MCKAAAQTHSSSPGAMPCASVASAPGKDSGQQNTSNCAYCANHVKAVMITQRGRESVPVAGGVNEKSCQILVHSSTQSSLLLSRVQRQRGALHDQVAQVYKIKHKQPPANLELKTAAGTRMGVAWYCFL